MAILFFLYFASVIIASSILTITLKSVIHCALSLLVAFIHIAGLYILLDAEFLAAVQLIVYSGAILVLYLFVMMLFQQHKEEKTFHKQLPFAFIIAGGIFAELMMVLNNSWFVKPQGDFTTAKVAELGNTELIGTILYTQYLYPFEVASVVLLVALVGAILLTDHKKHNENKLDEQQI